MYWLLLRYSEGVTPHILLKAVEKWFELSNPQTSAISVTESDEVLSSFLDSSILRFNI